MENFPCRLSQVLAVWRLLGILFSPPKGGSPVGPDVLPVKPRELAHDFDGVLAEVYPGEEAQYH